MPMERSFIPKTPWRSHRIDRPLRFLTPTFFQESWIAAAYKPFPQSINVSPTTPDETGPSASRWHGAPGEVFETIGTGNGRGTELALSP